MSLPPSRVAIRYDVPRSSPDWTLPEVPVPESALHDQVLDLLKALLLAWTQRAGLSAQVARNLAVRWDESRPRVGVDPDVCVIVPRTPEGDDLTALCTWKPGHATPKLAVEVVSASHPYEDYAVTPEKYAACGVDELWVFDPKLEGPKHAVGPHRIQVWRREGRDEFARVYAGAGPAFSPFTSAWLFAVSDGERLRLADDREGTRWWRTAEEQAREAETIARAESERMRARIEELERELERARAK